MNIEPPILTEQEQTRVQILDSLHRGVCSVIFTKANGEERTMKCTLVSSFLPEKEDTVKLATKNRKSGAVSVWDVEKNDWRAFRIDSVKSWQLIFHEDPA